MPIAGCVDYMVAYAKLNDSVLQLIKVSSNPSLREAKELIARLERRELYRYIGQTAPVKKKEDSKQLIPEDVRLVAALYI